MVASMSASGSRGGSSDPFWPSDPTEEVEEVAQAVSKAIVRAGAFLSDARCSFCVLGAVSDALPSTGRVFAERGLRVADIRGAWAVPAAVCDAPTGAGAADRPWWPAASRRLEPYLRHDLWRKIDGDVRSALDKSTPHTHATRHVHDTRPRHAPLTHAPLTRPARCVPAGQSTGRRWASTLLRSS